MNYQKICKELLKFREERDWKQFHNPKDLASAIAIEAAELQEKFLWRSQEDSYSIAQNNLEVHEEFSDIMMFMILFAEESWIDIESSILRKIEKNKERYSVEKSKGKSDKYNTL